MNSEAPMVNKARPGGFRPKFHWRIVGSPAPVFPGFEIDICQRISDDEKPDAVWHRDRARGILRRNPEVRELFGNSPSTAIWCLSLAAAQVAAAIGVSAGPWWLVFVVAYLFGSWVDICLFSLAHECNHGLVFGDRNKDRHLFTWTSLPMFLPAHHSWWIEHHVHHNDLGAKKDFVKRRRSTLLALKDNLLGYVLPPRIRPYLSWITTPLFVPFTLPMLIAQVVRSMVGLIVYAVTAIWYRRREPCDFALAILADPHLVSGYQSYGLRFWAVTYAALNLGFLSLLLVLFGWKPVVYLMMSILFMSGFLHPWMFGLLLSNSHFHGHRVYQPTASYYGWLNRFTFNFGLHTEHHDLASVPWNRLGRLRQMAPEFYDELLPTPSYAHLALKFAFGDREDFDNEEHRNLAMLEANGPTDRESIRGPLFVDQEIRNARESGTVTGNS